MLRKVTPGEPFQPSAGFHNRLVDQMVQSQRDAMREDSSLTQVAGDSTVVQVLNDTESPLRRYSIVGLGDPVILPSNNEGSFLNDLAFHGQVPTNHDAFAVVLDPIAPHTIGKALLVGIAIVKLAGGEVGRTADITPGETAHLTRGHGGPATILWAEEANGEQPRWAIVMVGGGVTTRMPAVIGSEEPTVVIADQKWRYPVEERRYVSNESDGVVELATVENGFEGWANTILESRTSEQFENSCPDAAGELERAKLQPGTPIELEFVRTPDGRKPVITRLLGPLNACAKCEGNGE